jgi:hypothetical protein
MSRIVEIPSSLGELLDKISILEIKAERIHDTAKLNSVRHELALLASLEKQHLAVFASDLNGLKSELKQVNEALWQLEDDIRECEREGRFEAHFIQLARSVYRQNDRRAAVKRAINLAAGSDIVEEKSYSAY